MTKWWDMFGKEHPEAFGKIEDPEDKTTAIYNTDLPEINYYMLRALCNKFGVNIQWVDNFRKTKKEQRKEYGF